MRRLLIRCLVAVPLALVAATVGLSAAAHEQRPAKPDRVDLELIGQVTNSTTTSAQYGYVSQLDDIAGWPSEAAAPLTFFTDMTTNRVVNNGPVRIVSRTGRLTIYSDPSPNGNFADPDSFRDGTPVLTATVRQQVILNTLTSAFTAHNVNTIISQSRFALGDHDFLLGRVGGRFHTVISGQAVSTAPPSAYMAGYTFSSRGRVASRP